MKCYLLTILIFISAPLFIIVLVQAISSLLISDTVHTNLEKAYFLGGIVTGIFAFGAFIFSVLSNSQQRRTSAIQQFETTFFNMMTLQQQIVNDLSDTYTVRDTNIGRFLSRYSGSGISTSTNDSIRDRTVAGRDLFEHLFGGMQRTLETDGLQKYSNSEIPTHFDHYSRHLYTIIKFVDSASILESAKAKYKYTSMIRATLSRYELVWLYYNCLTDVGNEKFKPLLEKYAMLKNMRTDLLALCNENKNVDIEKSVEKQLEDSEFSGTDYEFFLTTEHNNKSKYYIGAFYSAKELNEGVDLVKKWDIFVKKNNM